MPVGVARAGRSPGEDLDPVVDGPDRPDVEALLTHRGHDFLAKHEIAGVLVRDDDPLPPRQPLDLARVLEALDLFVDAPDGLDLPHLVDRAGDRDSLVDRESSE